MLHYWPILLLAPGGRQIDPNIDGVERPPWRWVDAKGIGSTLLVLNPPHRSQSLQRTNLMVQTLLLSDLPPHTLLLTASSSPFLHLLFSAVTQQPSERGASFAESWCNHCDTVKVELLLSPARHRFENLQSAEMGISDTSPGIQTCQMPRDGTLPAF